MVACCSRSPLSFVCVRQQKLARAPPLVSPSYLPFSPASSHTLYFLSLPSLFLLRSSPGGDPREARGRHAMACGCEPLAHLMDAQMSQADDVLDRSTWHGAFEQSFRKDERMKRVIKPHCNAVIPECEHNRVDVGLSQPCSAPAPPEDFLQEVSSTGEDELWLTMRSEARRDAEAEPALASFLYSTILAHRSLDRALAFHLGNKLASTTLLSTHLVVLILDTFTEDAEIREAVRADIIAVKERDPACVSYSHCMLNFKGFLACQAHRVAHRLWNQGRNCLALVIQSRVSEEFHVDIHPAAKIGKGVLFDHATGVVVGETAVIGNNVSILHNVTLGGTGAFGCDRHPKIGDGVLVGAGSILLGPITIGEGAKIGAGSVVLTDVPPYTTAVGNPARLFGGKRSPQKLQEIPSRTMDHTSFIESWSDYII